MPYGTEKSVAKADLSQIPGSRVQKLLETPEAQAEPFERYGIKVVVTLIQLEGRIAKAVLVENTERVEDDSCTFGPQGQINPASYRTESLGTYRLLAFGPTQVNSKVLAELKVFDAIEQQKAIGKAQLLEAALHVIPFGTAADAAAGGNVSGTELLLATIGDAAWLGTMAAKLTWKSGQAVFATQKAVRIARGTTILNRGADIGQIGVAAKDAVEEPTAWKIVVAAGIATLTLFGLAWRKVASKKILTKGERLAEFNKRLSNAPGAKSADEALEQIGKTLDDVEDAFSGVPKSKNPGLEYDGRMYPPQPDNIRRLPDGSIKVRTKGNRIDIEADGSIKITDLDGNLILTKPGG